MKKISKPIYFIALAMVITVGLISFGVLRYSSQDKFNKTSDTSKSKQTSPKTKRVPAATKAKLGLKKIGDRIIIGDKVQKTNDIKYINETNPEWQTAYTKKLLRLGKGKKISQLNVEHQKSMVEVKRKSARNLEHVRVSYLDENGNPFSFEALIDSETGSMVRSWNQTRYEFKKPIVFSTEGTALYKD